MRSIYFLVLSFLLLSGSYETRGASNSSEEYSSDDEHEPFALEVDSDDELLALEVDSEMDECKAWYRSLLYALNQRYIAVGDISFLLKDRSEAVMIDQELLNILYDFIETGAWEDGLEAVKEKYLSRYKLNINEKKFYSISFF